MGSTGKPSGDSSSKHRTSNGVDIDLRKLTKAGYTYLEDLVDDEEFFSSNGSGRQNNYSVENYADLDDVLYGKYHKLKQELDDGANSLVFNAPILEGIKSTSSFDTLFPNADSTPITEDGEVQKLVLQQGNGTAPKKGVQIWIHYIMFAEVKDGPTRSPIDSTEERHRLETFKLDKSQRILSMNIALATMEYGEVSLFISTPDYAYGFCGCPPRVPRDSNILFIIELTELDVSSSTPLFQMSVGERQRLEFSQVLDEVEDMNQDGNAFFSGEEYHDAVRCYNTGIHILVNYNTVYPADKEEKKRQLYKMYSNLAATFLELEEPHRACEVFEIVKRKKLPMLNGKLYYRNAKGLWKLNKLEEALKSLDNSLKLEPGHPEAVALRHRLLSKLRAEEKEGNALEEKMAQVFVISVEDPNKVKVKTAAAVAAPPSLKVANPAKSAGMISPIRNQFSAELALKAFLKKSPPILQKLS